MTVGARKLYDILRSLPEDAEVSLEAKENRMTVKAGKSRFNLQTLAAGRFPARWSRRKDASKTLTLPQKALKDALGLVQFAMAVQDIRYYLNGVLFSVDKDTLRVVATDGHRLSFASRALDGDHGSVEAILPRKTVLELIKLLGDTDDPVSLAIGSNQARFSFGGIEIVSKIVEGKFPDYQKVIPTTHKNRVSLDRRDARAVAQPRGDPLEREDPRRAPGVHQGRAVDHLHEQRAGGGRGRPRARLRRRSARHRLQHLVPARRAEPRRRRPP